MVDNYIAFFTKFRRDHQYHVYVADALKAISENTAKWVGGTYMTMRYIDVIEPHIEKRSADEIKEHIKDKLRGFANDNSNGVASDAGT